jgi:hypothetical protein
MNWLNWCLSIFAVGVNLHALVALVLCWRKSGPELRSWARRSRWLAVTLPVLSGVVVVFVVRLGESPETISDPAARASRLASQIAQGLNCAAFGAVASVLPAVVAFWLWRRARSA